MLIKILNAILILIAVFMGIKQGWAMLAGKQEMLALFGKWNFNRTGVFILGVFTLLSAILLLFPKTFVWGNFLMSASILMIIFFHLHDRDWKGVAIELPFFLLNLVIVYLRYPLIDDKF